MEKQFFGIDKSGNKIYRYTLTDRLGNRLSVLNYGAVIQSLEINDKNGGKRDVVLGYDNMARYEKEEGRTYFGAVCGRTANRIEGARFYIDGQEYLLDKNNGDACLHGGNEGLDRKFFDLTDADSDYMTFSVFSPDGESGFPGNMSLSVKYTLRNGLLMIEYMARVTASCPVSLTNHSYFNLDGGGDILGHSLQLNSHFYMEVRDDGCATGLVKESRGTPFDFTRQRNLGRRIERAKKRQPATGGIDHHLFCDSALSEYRKFGTLTSSDGVLKMDIFTDRCGAQIYTGNFLTQDDGKNGPILPYGGICIETQSAPGALKYSHLPRIILHRGERYYSKTGFRFYC